jgi:signal peptidase II
MRVLFVTLAVYILDQFTKFAVKGISIPGLGIHWEGMSYAQSIHLIGNWCKITFIENPNMAFGFEFGGKVLLSVFAILASIGIVVYLYRNKQAPVALRVALALILAGAIGNLTDRVFYGLLYGYAPLFYGNVVDFIDLDLFTVAIGSGGFKFWPVFNVADCAVSVGVVLYILRFKPSPRLSKSIVTEKGIVQDSAPEAPDAAKSFLPGDTASQS